MKTIAWLLSIGALLAVLAGCEPFETELTLNDDGSGKLVQSVHLSPAAHSLLRQNSGLRMKGWRPILTKEAADAWGEANPKQGVKLLDYSSVMAEDGSLKVRYEVLFIDLRDLMESPWGFPLQMKGVMRGEAMRVEIEDPLRAAVRLLIGAQSGPVGASAPMEAGDAVGYLHILNAMAPSQRTRLTVNLPVPAAGIESGTLSADKLTATREYAIGGAPLLVEWFKASPLAVDLPVEKVRFKPFSAPETLVQKEALVSSQEVEARKEDGFEIKPGNMGLNTNRGVYYQEDGRANNSGVTALNINMNFYGPDNLRIMNPNSLEEAKRPVHMLAAAKDDTGADLRTGEGNLLSFNVHNYGDGYYGSGRRALASVNINLKQPAEQAKTLTNLEGYVTVLAVVEEDRLELKPISAYYGKSFELTGMTVRVDEPKGQQININIQQPRGRQDYSHEQMQSFKFLTADGGEIRRQGWGGGGGGPGGQSYNVHLSMPMPGDGAVVISAPSLIRPIKVPFSLKDVPLP